MDKIKEGLYKKSLGIKKFVVLEFSKYQLKTYARTKKNKDKAEKLKTAYAEWAGRLIYIYLPSWKKIFYDCGKDSLLDELDMNEQSFSGKPRKFFGLYFRENGNFHSKHRRLFVTIGQTI